jgi:hypothetical protein
MLSGGVSKWFVTKRESEDLINKVDLDGVVRFRAE